MTIHSDYLSHPALGSTAIRAAAQQSVAHYLARTQRPPTAAMRRGTLTHAATLEPAVFAARYVRVAEGQCDAVTSRGSRCTKTAVPGTGRCHFHGGRNEAAAWQASHPGQELVAADDYDAALAAAAGIRAGLARAGSEWLLEQGQAEAARFGLADRDGHISRCSAETAWQAAEACLDGDTAMVPVRGLIDLIVPSDAARGGLALDLKGTSRGIDERRFGWQVEDLGLHVQAALYLAILGEGYTWGWIAHEAEPPYAVRIHEPAQVDLDAGAELVREGLRRWRAYYESGDEWTGWPTGRTTIYRPAVVRTEEPAEGGGSSSPTSGES